MAIKKINQADFEAEVKAFDGIILLDFYADWCGPCRVLDEIFKEFDAELEKNNPNNVKILKLNIDNNPEMAMEFQITGIPNVGVFHKGELKNQIIGLNQIETYQKAIADLVL